VRPSLAAVLLVFGALTALRNADYATEVTLWEQTARVSPAKPRVFNNLGFALSAAGRLDEAEAAYREALRLDPGYSLAQDNLERLLERKARGPGADPQRQ
jgi:Flp pilus assembly protein TadD